MLLGRAESGFKMCNSKVDCMSEYEKRMLKAMNIIADELTQIRKVMKQKKTHRKI